MNKCINQEQPSVQYSIHSSVQTPSPEQVSIIYRRSAYRCSHSRILCLWLLLNSGLRVPAVAIYLGCWPSFHCTYSRPFHSYSLPPNLV